MSIETVQWQAPPDNLFLKVGEVHVWLIDCNVETRHASSLLDADEKSRAARFVFDDHKKRFIAAHVGLRKVLSRYTYQTPKEIMFVKSETGKPALHDFPDIHFNLTHSEDIALCAVSRNPVGIDVENLDKRVDYKEIAKRFFAPHETVENSLDFFKYWTQKEAYLKALGSGISAGLDIEIPNDFVIRHFMPGEGYLAAVGSGSIVSFFG